MRGHCGSTAGCIGLDLVEEEEEVTECWLNDGHGGGGEELEGEEEEGGKEDGRGMREEGVV